MKRFVLVSGHDKSGVRYFVRVAGGRLITSKNINKAYLFVFTDCEGMRIPNAYVGDYCREIWARFRDKKKQVRWVELGSIGFVSAVSLSGKNRGMPL